MSYRTRHRVPDLGIGVGFRVPHRAKVLGERPPMDWFEVISESFMVAGGRPLETLARLRDGYRVVPHGVSLAVGSVEPLDQDYLRKLRELVDRLDPPWVSDHLCWGRASGLHLHDLLPLPYTREAVDHVVERVKRVQGTLERPFALENVSTYMAYRSSTMPEWEFVAEIAERADCGLLLDCNNAYVSARNHGLDPEQHIDAMPEGRVVQIHLAGHTDKGAYLLDTHDGRVSEEVWALYRRAIARCGAVATLVEWDEAIPTWEVLAAEAQRARVVRDEALATVAA
ncbi:MAG TPA: DUF692 domain-containing protein [Labilithrix sp.]|nr:DUF692 domain-containing protein [Labilithrix sp.]